MFMTADCTEAQTGVIEINNIKASVMEALIQYMHLKTVDDLDGIARELFVASDKYDMDELTVSLLLFIWIALKILF